MADDRGFIEIDQNQLDKECLEQARLYLAYATVLADAEFAVAEAKAELEVEEAEIELKVRESPETFNIDKITESTIKAVVTTAPSVQRLRSALNTARHKVDIAQAAVRALDHRKRMLELSVALHGQSYFAAPRIDNEVDRDRIENNRAKRRYAKTSGAQQRTPKDDDE